MSDAWEKGLTQVEFACEGCGSHVFSFRPESMKKHLCFTCMWLEELAPEERAEARLLLE